jgi:phenylacetate-CoA ligase
MTIYHDPMSVAANLAYCEPEKEVVRQFFGRGRAVRQISIYYPGSSVLQIWDVYRRITFIPPPAEHLVLSVADPLDKVIAALNAFRPDLLIGYGSYLEGLFRMAHARQITLHPPRLVMYGADMMTEPGRRLIEEQFGIPVYSRYRAVESFQIGFTCEKGQGFHIRSDLCDLKLVDAQGRRVPAGQPGEIVISNLVNRGTVLLNYRLGDVGVMSGEACGCGRTLPVLTGLLGRAEDALALADGRIIDPRLVWNIFKDRPEIIRYQLIQHEPARFALNLVTTDRDAYDRNCPVVVEDLRRLLGPVQIEPSFHTSLETSASGKFRPVVSHCRTGASQ